MGPWSTFSSTKWTVQPDSLAPYSSACFWGCSPGNAGSREGWMLMIFPSKARINFFPRIRMKPAKQTRSTSLDFNRSIIPLSYSSREEYFFGSRNTDSIPDFFPLTRAGASSTLLRMTEILADNFPFSIIPLKSQF